MLTEELKKLDEKTALYEKETRSEERFIALVDRYQGFTELTASMINEFVEKIVIYEKEIKGRSDSPQRIEIFFNQIGKYLPPGFDEKLSV